MQIFDQTACALGEGTLWHPLRNELIWFDILGAVMYRRGSETVATPMAEMCSAAGWVDENRLLIAAQSRLMLYDIAANQSQTLALLEADDAETRSNDGRADPQGGFWIGTMEMSGAAGRGALYRYAEGGLVKLQDGLSIPNSICFSPDGSCAYYADTAAQTLWRQPLDARGWPAGAREIFMDFKPMGLFPDGAITDAEGRLFIAHWGAGCIGVYTPEGAALARHILPAPQPTCPAFGGPMLQTLFCSSATVDLAPEALTPSSGNVFALSGLGQGRPEPRVRL